jgi:hypothetical protein
MLTSAPACNFTERFVIAASNPQFKSTVAAFLAAYHAGAVSRLILGASKEGLS